MAAYKKTVITTIFLSFKYSNLPAFLLPISTTIEISFFCAQLSAYSGAKLFTNKFPFAVSVKSTFRVAYISTFYRTITHSHYATRSETKFYTD